MSRVPRIRCKGFEEDWEQRKLGEVCNIITKQTGFDYSSTIKPALLKEKADNTYPFIQNKDFNGTTINMDTDFFIPISVAEKFPNIVLDRPSLLISISGRIGNVGFYSCVHKAFIGGAVGICKLKYNDDGKFIIHELESEYGQKYFHLLIKASSHANITVEDIRNMELIFPNKKEEKVCISTFFSTLDRLITLHQRKLEKLKIIKKSMLENLFPQNGEKTSKIRFSGFTEDWEQRKFSDITYPAGEKNRDNLPLESYSITNEHGFIPQDEKFENGGTMREADKRMYYIVSPQSFAYNPARINVGSIGYQNLNKNVIVSSLYEVFKSTEDVDDRFLWHWFKSDDFQKLIIQLQEGGVRLYFYYDKLCMGSVSLPSVEEQHQIGVYLDRLDHLITLHQSKLEKLQKIKKSMLESMFV